MTKAQNSSKALDALKASYSKFYNRLPAITKSVIPGQSIRVIFAQGFNDGMAFQAKQLAELAEQAKGEENVTDKKD